MLIVMQQYCGVGMVVMCNRTVVDMLQNSNRYTLECYIVYE